MRLPRGVPAAAVRRVVCQGCREPYETDALLEVGVLAGDMLPMRPEPGNLVPVSGSAHGDKLHRRPRVPGWLSPRSRAWRYLSVPVAGAAVVGGLLLIQGSDEAARDPGASSASAAAATSGGAANARVVKGSSFTVALPPAWERTNPTGGATFAASAADGTADATLWIERAPRLSLQKFEARSLDQLRGLAGSAHVVKRVAAPTPEATVVTLAADNPAGEPSYEVTLRVAGPYRYYLATSVSPDGSRQAVDGAELIHNSFVPAGRGGSR